MCHAHIATCACSKNPHEHAIPVFFGDRIRNGAFTYLGFTQHHTIMIAKKISVNGFIRKNDAIARNREQLKQVIDTCGSCRFLLGDRN